jgi:hypothetical protein
LICRRVDVDRAVGEDKHLIGFVAEPRHDHEEVARHGLDARGESNGQRPGLNHRCGSGRGAGHHRVGIVAGDHHSAVKERLGHHPPGDPGREVVPALHIASHVRVQTWAVLRIDCLDAVQGHSSLCRSRCDLRARPENDRLGNLPAADLPGRKQNPTVPSFRQDHAQSTPDHL